MTKNALWDLIQRYMDDRATGTARRPPTWLAKTGVSDQVISK